MELINICRLCAKLNDKLLAIFNEDPINYLTEKILSVSSIQIVKDDGLPNNICEFCEYKLEEAYNFRQQILLADEKLRMYISTPKLSTTIETADQIKVEDKHILSVDAEDNYENFEHVALQDIGKIEFYKNFDSEKIVIKGEQNVEQTVTEHPYKKQEHPTGTRQCPECGKLIKLNYYREHMLTQHKIGTMKCCNLCDTKVNTRKQLVRHIKATHEAQEISCDQCGVSFANKSILKSHYRIHSNTENISNNENEKLEFEQTIKLPTKKRRIIGFKECPECLRVLKSNSWREHRLTQHNVGTMINCDLCDTKVKTRKQLRRHKKENHDLELVNNMENINNDLDKNSDDIEKAKLERRKLQRKVTRICPECGKLLQRDSFNEHMLTIHNKGTRVECNICGLKVKSRLTLWTHKRIKHLERKAIKCDRCDKYFATRESFKEHQNVVHLGLKKFSCHLCDKVFGRLNSLKGHIRSHTGERPYICTFCNKGFSGRWALKQHGLLHTNEKPYKCQQCPEAFAQNVTLKLHVKRKHLGITPFEEKQSKIKE